MFNSLNASEDKKNKAYHKGYDAVGYSAYKVKIIPAY